MTDVRVPSVPHRPWSSALGWVRAKDPDFLAGKRSVRAAVVMPTVFGLAHLLFGNAQISLFGAFGSFSLLLLVDFPGRPRTRLLSYVALFLVGCCFIALGTVASGDKAMAVVAMAVVGFVVLFVGVVSPQMATASTAALLVFVLPVAVTGPPSAVGPRLVGWALAGAFCIPACMFIWPTPWHDNLRRRLSATAYRSEPVGGGPRRARARRSKPGRPWSRSCPASEASSGRPPTRRAGLPLVRWPWPSWSVGSSGSPPVSHWPRARRPRPICQRSGR